MNINMQIDTQPITREEERLVYRWHAENERLRKTLRKLKRILSVPRAWHARAIHDALDVIDEALGESNESQS